MIDSVPAEFEWARGEQGPLIRSLLLILPAASFSSPPFLFHLSYIPRLERENSLVTPLFFLSSIRAGPGVSSVTLLPVEEPLKREYARQEDHL